MRVSTLVIILAIIGGGGYFAWKKGIFGEAQQKAEASFDVHLSKGQGLYQTQKYDEAIVELDKALALDATHPDAPIALMRKGDCLKEQRKIKEAVAVYEQVVSKYPNFKMRGQVEQSIEKCKSIGYN